MKIVYISSSTIPSQAANSIHVMKMCQAFAHHGHEVTLIAKRGATTLTNEQILADYDVTNAFPLQVFKLPKVRGIGYWYALKAAWIAKASKPNLVYCRNVFAAYFASLLGCKVMYESHAPISYSGKLSDFVFRRLLRTDNFLKLVVITDALANYYLSEYQLALENIHVAPDGADEFPDNVQPKDLGGKSGRPQVGYVGHLYKGKGMEVVLPLAEMSDFADFHVVGGTEKDIQHWKEQAKNISNLIFHGHVPHSETHAYIKAFDIVLLPNQQKVSTHGSSTHDIGQWTSPLKAFEYMAAGKVIICSDLEVLHEVLTDKFSCVMCTPESTKEWHSSLCYLLQNPDFSKSISENAFDIFNAKFTWYARAEKILRLTNENDHYE